MLKTETRNKKTIHIDKMSNMEMLQIINEENMNSVNAVGTALNEISEAIDLIVDSINKGGKIYYMGAGTSGRLAVSDAAECPPTFGVDQDLFTAIIAGGPSAIIKAQENVEDNAEAGKTDLLSHGLTANDTVIGISASGGATYVFSALEAAKKIGAHTVSISNNPEAKIAKIVDVAICVVTGPEVITGSTRMKAGNSQKMILNMLSTCAMVKTGKVYENLMINLKPTNIKLTQRMIGIVCDITGVDETTAKQLLDENEWKIREAVDAYNK